MSVLCSLRPSKTCLVPHCKNTTDNRIKLFINVPEVLYRRKKWFNALSIPDSPQAQPYVTLVCCEDHFNLAEDAKNWFYYRTVGTKLCLREDVVPHKFIDFPAPPEYKEFTQFPLDLREEKSKLLGKIRKERMESRAKTKNFNSPKRPQTYTIVKSFILLATQGSGDNIPKNSDVKVDNEILPKKHKKKQDYLDNKVIEVPVRHCGTEVAGPMRITEDFSTIKEIGVINIEIVDINRQINELVDKTEKKNGIRERKTGISNEVKETFFENVSTTLEKNLKEEGTTESEFSVESKEKELKIEIRDCLESEIKTEPIEYEEIEIFDNPLIHIKSEIDEEIKSMYGES